MCLIESPVPSAMYRNWIFRYAVRGTRRAKPCDARLDRRITGHTVVVRSELKSRRNKAVRLTRVHVQVHVCVRESERERERAHERVCVREKFCAWECERERECVCVCECVYVCMCVCV